MSRGATNYTKGAERHAGKRFYWRIPPGIRLDSPCLRQQRCIGNLTLAVSTARPARTTATRNSIGDKGVALLARSLRVNSSVETLALGGNRVTDEGAASIAGEQTVGSCNTISSSSSRQGCAEPRHQRLRAWAGFDVLRFSKNPC